MKPPGEELERRRPVWEALSAIFLDTEIDEAWYERIVSRLHSSGYSEAEMDRILWEELCPVLHGNLLSVAGEWAGFDMNAVEQRIISRPAGRVRQWLAYISGGKNVPDAWRRIKESLAIRRAA